MTDQELEALIHVIYKWTPDPAMRLTGVILACLLKDTPAGVELHVDWPQYLGRSPAEVVVAVGQRLAEIEAGR